MITHALETRSEMLYNLERYGKPALQRLADIGVLTPQTVLEHFVWVTDEELAIFADSGAVASNNPGSNLRLSSGICRVRDIMDTGGGSRSAPTASRSPTARTSSRSCGWRATCSGSRGRSSGSGWTARRCSVPRRRTAHAPLGMEDGLGLARTGPAMPTC